MSKTQKQMMGRYQQQKQAGQKPDGAAWFGIGVGLVYTILLSAVLLLVLGVIMYAMWGCATQ